MNALDVDSTSGQLQLLDSLVPCLTDGTYTLTVAQALSTADGPVGAIDDVTQTFSVGGPRFTLPASEVLTEFPPNGSTGSFDHSLPHVVLKEPQLPWERTLIPKVASLTPSWLALLVFGESELPGGPETMTVGDLLGSPPPNTRVPRQLDTSAEELAMQCQVITLASTTFQAIVPTLRETAHLAHTRRVEMRGKDPATGAEDGMFAVIVGNRFPLPGDARNGQRTLVHLVSLEGYADLLSGIRPALPAEGTVRLVTLYNWTFTCLMDPSQTFASLAANLATTGSPAVPRSAASLQLRLPYTPSSAKDPVALAAKQRLDSGYLPLGYHAQSGEDGFAWYRGPLTPVVANPVGQAGDFLNADSAIVYDEAHGVFDHSLAAAWQCGQSLALADQTFATTLLSLRQKASEFLSEIALQKTLAIQPKQDIVAGQLQALFQTDFTKTIGKISPLPTPTSAYPLARTRRLSQAASATYSDLKQTLARADVQSALGASLQADPLAISVANWLGQLQLLTGVPFVHLVPDATMLPAESIRFFFVDPNWIAALTAGALHLGIGTSLEAQLQKVLTQQLETMAAAAALSLRSTDPHVPVPPPGAIRSGLLLRSSLVAGWPGLTVHGSAAGTPVPLLRLDHLAKDVLFCLFEGLPDTVILEEPHEGLQFGVDGQGCAALRTLDGSSLNTRTGPLVYNPHTALQPVSIRPGGYRVLNLNCDPLYPTTACPVAAVDLLGELAGRLHIGTDDLGPANFALQMLGGPVTLTFQLNPQESAQ